MAQPFEPERLALTGEAFPVAEQIQTVGTPEYGFFSASDSGALAYQTGRPAGAPQLTWLDRTGQVLGQSASRPPLRTSRWPQMDDGRWRVFRTSVAALTCGSSTWPEMAGDPLHIRRRTEQCFSHLVAGRQSNRIWIDPSGQSGLYRKPASGAGREELLLATDEDKGPSSWSRDGRFLLYTTFVAPGVLCSAADWRPESGAPFSDASRRIYGDFSPDGKWIAYASNESGHTSVRRAVRSFRSCRGGQVAGLDSRWSAANVGARWK